MAVTNNYQQADTGTKMIHLGRNTRSTIVSKGISAGHSQNSYRGLVKISPRAEGARNHSQCDSLLLSPTCGAHTFPYADIQNETAVVEHAQEPVPLEWESFVAGSKNTLIPDTFRMQTFRNLASDNWSFTLLDGATIITDKHTLKLPIGSKACFEPYSIDGYANVSAWIRCGGLELSPTETLGFEWFRNGKKETKANVYVTTEGKDWFGYWPWHIDNNPVWVNLYTYNAVENSKGYFMADSLYAIGNIPDYSLFKGEGNWRDTTHWSHLPPERHRSALIKGNIIIEKPIACHNASVSEGKMHEL